MASGEQERASDSVKAAADGGLHGASEAQG